MSIKDLVGDGDTVTVDLDGGTVEVGGKTLKAQAFPPELMEIMQAGGLIAYVKKELGEVEAVSDVKKIALIPGDGIGKEIVPVAWEVVKKATALKLESKVFDLGAERYLATGEVFPEEIKEELKGFDAVFLGALGDPRVKPGVLERGILLTLRFEFDQFANLRPMKLYREDLTPLKNLKQLDVMFSGEHRRPLHRCRRNPEKGYARRGSSAGVGADAQRRGKDRSPGLRVGQKGRPEEGHPDRQEQRPHLRPRPLAEGVLGGSKRLSGA